MMITPQTPSIPLAIEKVPSLLDNLTLVEYVPKHRIQALLKSAYLMDHWDANNYSHNMAKENYENEKKQIEAYLAKNKKDCIPVIYKKPRHGWGRPYVNKSLGLTSLRKSVRETLFGDNYFIADLKNAQPCILQNICKANNIHCPCIDEYVLNRDKHIENVKSEFSVERKKAKKLFLRLFFSGTLEGWKKDNNITNPQTPPFVSMMESELRRLADIFKKENPKLYETARQCKESKKDKKNYIGSFFALYLQEYETRIVGSVLKWLMENTTLMDKKGVIGKVGQYEYDGINLLLKNIKRYPGEKTQFLLDLQIKTKELTGFELVWEEKNTEDAYNIADLLEDIENEMDVEVEEVEEPMDFELYEWKTEYQNLIDHNHRGIAELVEKLRPKNFIYNGGKWYGWDDEKKRWNNSISPLKKFIMFGLEKWLNERMKPFIEKFGDKKLKGTRDYEETELLRTRITSFIYGHLTNAHEVSSIVSVCCDIMEDTNDDLFDFNKNLFGCNNGVYDIENDYFRPHQFDDRITMTCGYDFEDLRVGKNSRELTEEDTQCFTSIKTILSQVFPQEDVRQLMLLVFSSGVSGKSIEMFFILNGSGGNGKGLLNEFIKTVLGDYYYDLDVSVILNRSKQGSGPNPEIAGMGKKRYVIMKEPPTHGGIENSVVKDITGGGVIKSRFCNSNKTETRLDATIGMECNVKLRLKETPTPADARRLCDVEYQSTFTNDKNLVNESKHIYLANPLLKEMEWKKKHAVYFLNILFEYLQILKENNYNFHDFIPESVKKRSAEYLLGCFDIHRLFTKLYQKIDVLPNTPKAQIPFVSIKSISSEIKQSEEYNTLRKNKQSEFTDDKIKEFFKTNVAYKTDFVERHKFYVEGIQKENRNVLLGWAKIPEEEDNNEDLMLM